MGLATFAHFFSRISPPLILGWPPDSLFILMVSDPAIVALFPARQKGLIELKLVQAGYARTTYNGQTAFIKAFDGEWGKRNGVVRTALTDGEVVRVVAHTEPDPSRPFARAWYELLGGPDHDEGARLLRQDLENAGLRVPTNGPTEGSDTEKATVPLNHRIFTSFAIEDVRFRDLLVGQARNDHSPFDFVDMSVKEPWDEQWKIKCRAKIRGCDGVIALISRNTQAASGARWEIQCAIEEGIPIVGMYVSKEDRAPAPPELEGKQIIEWSWDSIAAFLQGL